MNETNYVYILRSGNSQNFKIGVSKNIIDRIKQLQTGSPYKISLYHCFEATARKQAFECEHSLHKYFSKNKTKLMWGEWYRLTRKDLEILLQCDYIDEVKEILGELV